MKSVLSDYKPLISEMLESGATYNMVVDAIYDKYGVITSTTAICLFVKKNGLKSRITSGSRDNRIYIPICDECSECTKVTRPDEKGQLRLCLATLGLMYSTVHTSPMWCPKRGDFNNGDL